MIENKCPYFTKCGGCQIQGLPLANYCKKKMETLTQTLSVLGNVNIQPIQTFPKGIRRKANLQLDFGGKLGFHKLHTNEVVPILICPQLTNDINRLIIPLQKLCKSFVKRSEGSIIITEVSNGITIHFANINIMKLDLHKIKEFGEQHNKIIEITDDTETLFKRENPYLIINKVKVPFPPKTFIQPSIQSEQAIVAQVTEFAKSIKPRFTNIADIFCGLGLFSLSLKDLAENISAFDCDENAIKVLTKTAHSNHININAKTVDLFKHPIRTEKLNNFDLVVIDPPRDGADFQCTELSQSDVPAIIYVSCNPETFTRDAKQLMAGNYKISSIKPIDQFPNTEHLEIVALFTK